MKTCDIMCHKLNSYISALLDNVFSIIVVYVL